MQTRDADKEKKDQALLMLVEAAATESEERERSERFPAADALLEAWGRTKPSVLLFALDLAAQETQFYAPNKHLSGAGKEEANEAFLDAVARYLNCAKVELQATHRGTHGPLTVPKANALLAAHYLVAYGSTPNCARALNINQSTATRRAAHGHGVHRVQVDNAFRAYDADARDGGVDPISLTP
jgi:hypothetical protein